MATTLMPLDPATSPQRVSRILTISADLLPEEIVAARRARRTRAYVLLILAVVVALLAGWYVHALPQKSAADDELQGLTTEATTLQHSQNQDFSDVVGVQSQTVALDKQLTTVMAQDLRWAALLDTLYQAADTAKVTVTSITGSLTPVGANGAAVAGTASSLPSTSGALAVGTLTLTGSAPDKPAVAAFVIRLGKLGVVANPYLTSAAESDTGDGERYSLQVDITSAALCGRFTTTCKSGSK